MKNNVNKSHLRVRALCEGAIMVAIAQILSYIKLLPNLPNGGSITFAMFPVLLFAVRFGFGKGLMAGFAFGLLQLIFDGAYAWGWQSMLLDYLVAFTPLGLAGLFKGKSWGIFPEKGVSKGQFLAMMVKLLDIPTEKTSLTELDTDTPQWLKPYLVAAMRSGLTDGLPLSETGAFDAQSVITGAEAAVMLQNALDLTVSQQTLELEQTTDAPAWAMSSLTVLSQYGVQLEGDAELTRADAAKVLYQVSSLAIHAPGTAVFKVDQ